MLIIGLTGGIGAGKSTVCELFRNLGAPIIMADQIARDIVKPNTSNLTRIIQHFGKTILTPNGEIDRTLLRRRIFNDPNDKQWLEDLLHPQIQEKMLYSIKELTASYVILDIPLLLETKSHQHVDRILVVDTAEELQIKRIVSRDHVSHDDVLKIMNSQLSRTERIARADDIIYNENDLESLEKQVKELHKRYSQSL